VCSSDLLLIWLGFAWAYYGEPLPNTGHAKVGIYPTLGVAIEQGWTYLKDLVEHEPFAAVMSCALYGLGVALATHRQERAIALGLAAYAGYVVAVGGDFMRGRLLLPVFVGATMFGLLALVKYAPGLLSSQRLVLASLGTVAVIFGVGQRYQVPSVSSDIPPSGIVDEWLFYRGYHLFVEYTSATGQHGYVINPYSAVALVDSLKQYAAACGAVTIHVRNPGSFGYLAGPQVTVIDTLGLTDRFIARLPRTYLIDERPRPGHPDKRIPLWYLAQKGDIAFLRGWEEAVARLDCDFGRRTEYYRTSDTLYDPSTVVP